MPYLYHYTDEDSAKKIKRSGTIRQSGNDGSDDAAFGKGTYLTSLGPEHSKKTLALNNYDDSRRFHQSKIDDGKLDCYIRVKISKGDPKLERVSSGKRNIYKYNGNLKLSDKEHIVRRLRKNTNH